MQRYANFNIGDYMVQLRKFESPVPVFFDNSDKKENIIMICKITVAELYNQQYPIIRVSNGDSFFLQENDTGFGFNLEDDDGRIIVKDLPGEKELNVNVQGIILLGGQDYQINMVQKKQPKQMPKLNREDVLDYLAKSDQTSDLTHADRIQIFKTILSNGKDLTVDLMTQLYRNYQVRPFWLNMQNYDFFRFTTLVQELLIVPNKMVIPTDTLFEILEEYYKRSEMAAVDEDYESVAAYVRNNHYLMNDLKSKNENSEQGKIVEPKELKPVNFRTKTITWEQLTQVADVLFDHENDLRTFESLQHYRSEDASVEVLPDNRVIIRGQIYTPKCYVVPEVYSL